MGYSLTGRAAVSKTVGIGSSPIVPVKSKTPVKSNRGKFRIQEDVINCLQYHHLAGF